MEAQYNKALGEAISYGVVMSFLYGRTLESESASEEKSKAISSAIPSFKSLDDQMLRTMERLDASLGIQNEMRRIGRGLKGKRQFFATAEYPIVPKRPPLDKLGIELAWFDDNNEELLHDFKDMFVAIHDCEVIDSDEDDFRLAARVEALSKKVGPIAICRVCGESITMSRDDDPGFSAFESPVLWELEK